MSVKRYHAYHSGDPSQVGLWPSDEGVWVLYADHLAAVEREQRGALGDRARATREARADALREALAAVKAAGCWCGCDCSTAISAISRLIKEEASDE